MIKHYFLFVFCTLCSIGLSAQVSINSGGSSGAGTSFSIGQVAYVQFQNSNITFQQGVQQSWPQDSGLQLWRSIVRTNLSLYPNPAHTQLNISRLASLNLPLEYQIVDARGSLKANGQLKSAGEGIDVDELKPGFYFLILIEDGRKISNLKFIKT